VKAPDLSGQRFGRLTVVERAGASSSGNVTWWCVCDCGGRTRSAGTDLRRGRTVSCGCHARDVTRQRHAQGRDLVGQRFGRLTVVAFAGVDSYPRATWRCRCDCGDETTVAGHHLSEGSTVSCGCRAADPRPGARREDPGYTGAHYRVKFIHGPASAHSCVDCGGCAEDWSYDHADPDELTDPRGRPYSLDPSRYAARCRSCHKRFDYAAQKSSRQPA
jgi:hypothetical protein